MKMARRHTLAAACIGGSIAFASTASAGVTGPADTGTDSVQVTSSEKRSFAVPANQPRIQGRYRVRVHGTPQIWTFRPRCSAGACNTVMTRPGQRGGAMLRWDASRRRYVGRFTLQSPARERVCIITRRRNGLVVSRRTHRNVYAASQGTIVLSPRALITVSNRTLAGFLVGRQTARYVPTARGRALGCPTGRRASAQLVAQRR